MTQPLKAAPFAHEPVPDYPAQARLTSPGTGHPGQQLSPPHPRRHRTRDRPTKQDDYPDYIPAPDYSDEEVLAVSPASPTSPTSLASPASPASPTSSADEQTARIVKPTSPKQRIADADLDVAKVHIMDNALLEMGFSTSPTSRQHLRYEPEVSVDELVGAQTLPNPVADSSDRRVMHRELLGKHKRGELFSERSELQRKYEERRVKVELREAHETQRAQRTSLDRKLEQQALKLQQYEQQMEPHSEESGNELQRAFQKLKVSSTSETNSEST